MSFVFFCPSHFEIPTSFKSRTTVFGMGKQNAEKLARELLRIPKEKKILIFGCAGSLNPRLSVGQIYSIGEISGKSLPVIPDFPLASIASSPVIVKTPRAKAEFRKSRAVDLVDQEMEYLVEAVDESVRARLYFLRGVIDGVNDDISFFEEGGRVRWQTFVSPLQVFHFFRFVRNFGKYRTGMKSALKKIG